MDGDIVFDHVSFRYETGPDVLSDVSFTIPAGSSFGILGGTGSGKSSLLLMLCVSLLRKLAMPWEKYETLERKH